MSYTDFYHEESQAGSSSNAGITATFSLPKTTFKEAAESLRCSRASAASSSHLRASSPSLSTFFRSAASISSASSTPCTAESSTIENGSDYFAPRLIGTTSGTSSKRSSTRLTAPGIASLEWLRETFLEPSRVQHAGPSAQEQEQQRQQQEHLAILFQDAASMSRHGASRWKKTAVTMPRRLWKSEEDDGQSCDNLFLGAHCDKVFGAFVLGKYRMPNLGPFSAGLVMGPSVASSSSSASTAATTSSRPNSAYLGSVKITQKTSCWRCGNCFCDDHSSHYATLILDRDDAPIGPTETPGSSSIYDHEVPASTLDSPTNEATFVLTTATNPPHRSAASSLHHYLSQSPTARSTDKTSTRGGGESSRVSSANGGNSGISLRSNESQRRRQTSASSWLSQAAGVNSSHDAASMAEYLAGASLADDDQEHGGSLEAERQPISTRMVSLPDGRYLVRERICDRCSNIVEQARTHALHKQQLRDEMRNGQISVTKANMEASQDSMSEGQLTPLDACGPPRRSSDPVGQSAEDQEYVASLHRLFDEYRREKRRRRGQFNSSTRTRSEDSLTHRAARNALERAGHHVEGSFFPLAPPPQNYRRHRQSSPHSKLALEDEDDNSDDEEEEEADKKSKAHLKTPLYLAHLTGGQATNTYQHPAPVSTPTYGMGGQRLKLAVAPYQHISKA